ncbi:MAG: Peptidase family [Clostridiales bacterium]|jgi:hypothetical protein|nr:Peptidase family [Clostridiales bacterium]
MMTTKKRLILTFCTIFLIVTISGCNKSVDVSYNTETLTETVSDAVTTSSNEDIKTNPVITETLEFIYSRYDGDNFELEAIKENSLFYLPANDFIDLCNFINKNNMKIELLDYNSYNPETMELTLIYKSKVNIYTQTLGSAVSTAGLTFESVEFFGEDKLVIINLDDQVIKPIINEGQQYIPISYINYIVFSGQPCLLRTGENTYDLSPFSFDMELTEVADAYINPEYSDYKLALLILEDYLYRNYPHYQRFDIPDRVESYLEYYLIMFQMCDSLKDSHFFMFIDQDFIDKLIEIGWNDIYDKSNKCKVKTLEKSKDLPNEIEWLSNSCLYIPIRTFMEVEEISKLDEVLINDAEKLSNHINIVVDLRNNGGGTSSNVFMFLQKIMVDTMIVQVSNNHQNEMMGSAKYTIKSSDYKERNYSFTVIVNETSASAAVSAASILKDNFDADIIGREPVFKKTENMEYLQLPDGTLITLSRPDYSFIDKDGIRVDDSILVDQTMTDEQVDELLESLRD